MKPTGKAHAIMRPTVAAHEVRYRSRTSRAPSSRLCQTISFGWASIHFEYIVEGWLFSSESFHRIEEEITNFVVANTLRQNMRTHLKITADECTSQEFTLDNIFPFLVQNAIQFRDLFLLTSPINHTTKFESELSATHRTPINGINFLSYHPQKTSAMMRTLGWRNKLVQKCAS